MKKLWTILFCALMFVGSAASAASSHAIDKVATSAAPWAVGEVVASGQFEFSGGHYDVYRKFLGVTRDGCYLVQDFHKDGDAKYTDPYKLMYEKNVTQVVGYIHPMQGSYVRWYKNGQKMQHGQHKDGRAVGEWVMWHDNGQQKLDSQYVDGMQSGIWHTWDEKGTLIKEQNYDQ